MYWPVDATPQIEPAFAPAQGPQLPQVGRPTGPIARFSGSAGANIGSSGEEETAGQSAGARKSGASPALSASIDYHLARARATASACAAPGLRCPVLRADQQVQGSGLGLAIVSALVELYGGSVTLATSPLGGTRARLELPRL
jgi:hypothetical protein